MGGCKCSYRSCPKASDGKTHFFHFPVRDPERCQKWIVNVNRPDFKSYTMAQLKNKVVCQHHFPDNMFMNYMHERLVHTAVPNKESSPNNAPQHNANEEIQTTQIDELETYTAEELNIKILDTTTITDDFSVNKELSTMTVNDSPITGLSYYSPHDKKLHEAPYVEILTRLHGKPVPINNIAPKSENRPLILKNRKYLPKEDNNYSKTSNKKVNILFDQNITPVLDKSIIEPKPISPENATNLGKLKRKNRIYMPMEKPLRKKQNIESTINTGSEENIKKITTQKISTYNIVPVEPTPSTSNAYTNLVTESARMLNEMRSIQGKIEKIHEDREKDNLRYSIEKRNVRKNKFQLLSKASLYTQIVPFLSSELAKRVHMEMFPSLRRMHRK